MIQRCNFVDSIFRFTIATVDFGASGGVLKIFGQESIECATWCEPIAAPYNIGHPNLADSPYRCGLGASAVSGSNMNG